MRLVAVGDDGTGFLLVRLWVDGGADPTLRARLFVVLDIGSGEVRTVLATGPR